jgi:hypothetical protein
MMTVLRRLARPAVLLLAAVAVPASGQLHRPAAPGPPAPVPSALPGWERGLAGPAGGRVLLVLPPDPGYGQAGDPPDVDGHDTLIFAVDILAAL